MQRQRITSNPGGPSPQHGSVSSIALRLGPAANEALRAESSKLGVSAEELVSFAVLYYLADLDSGRIARAIPRTWSAQREQP